MQKITKRKTEEEKETRITTGKEVMLHAEYVARECFSCKTGCALHKPIEKLWHYIKDIYCYENKQRTKSNKMKFLMSTDTKCVTLGNAFNFLCLNFLVYEGFGLELFLGTTQ